MSDLKDADRPENEKEESALDTQAARREVLRRLGVYSAITAPALLILLKSEKAVAQTAPGPGIPGCVPIAPGSCPGGGIFG